MKLLLENWREFLKEGIDPRIQKQIDNLFALPEVSLNPESAKPLPANVAVGIDLHGGSDQITVFYCLIHKESGKFARRTSKEDTGIPHGLVIAVSPDEHPWEPGFPETMPPCLNGFTIASTKATRGWGPLLYEVVLEWTSQEGRAGLMADRRGVSDYAVAVWDKYLDRGDVDKKQLDIDPEGAEQFNTQQLTPDDPEDDCSQKSAVRRGGSDGWQDTSISKLYNKPNAEAMSALGARLIIV